METNEDSIIKFVKEFAEIWNQHDANKMASCFVNDGEFTNVIGEYAAGRDEIEGCTPIRLKPF